MHTIYSSPYIKLFFSFFREKGEFLSNSKLTGTTSQLSQHSIYNPDNYREKRLTKKYAKSMTDLANNLEYLSDRVNDTLTEGISLKRMDKEIEDEIRKEVREEIKASTFSKPISVNETLRSGLDEDKLLDLYEKRVGELDEMSGRPVSPRDSQWFVNPNHLNTTCEAPTLQSIGKSYRYGEKSKAGLSDKDRVALEHFPVTLGSSYEMSALDYPASEPLNKTAPPSMRTSRAKSDTKLGRIVTFRTKDRSFKSNKNLDKIYLMTKEAPVTGMLCEVLFIQLFNQNIEMLLFCFIIIFSHSLSLS